jgi:hypothetical protein
MFCESVRGDCVALKLLDVVLVLVGEDVGKGQKSFTGGDPSYNVRATVVITCPVQSPGTTLDTLNLTLFHSTQKANAVSAITSWPAELATRWWPPGTVNWLRRNENLSDAFEPAPVRLRIDEFPSAPVANVVWSAVTLSTVCDEGPPTILSRLKGDDKRD